MLMPTNAGADVGFVWNAVESKGPYQIQDCTERRYVLACLLYGTTTIKGTERYDKDVKQVFDQ